MRIVGIVMDNTGKNKEGYVLFSENKAFGSLFKIFNVSQVKFLIQSNGNLENAELVNGEIVITENSEERFPKYTVNGGSVNNYGFGIMIVEKVMEKPPRYKVLQVGKLINQCVATTLTEAELLSYAKNPNCTLINAKLVTKGSTEIIQGIKKEIKTVEPPKAQPKPQPQQPQTPPEPRDKNGRTKSEKDAWRHKLAEEKVISTTANSLVHYLQQARFASSIIHLPSKSVCPAREEATYAKVLGKLAMKYARTDEEKEIAKKNYQQLAAYILQAKMQSLRTIDTKLAYPRLIQFLLREPKFVDEVKYAISREESHSSRRGYTVKKGITTAPTGTLAEQILNDDKISSKFKNLIKSETVVGVDYQSSRTLNNGKAYVLVDDGRNSKSFYSDGYKCVNLKYDWNEFDTFANAVSNDSASLVYLKSAYIYLNRLAKDEVNDLYGGELEIEEIKSYMAARVIMYLAAVSTSYPQAVEVFATQYADELSKAHISKPVIEGIKSVDIGVSEVDNGQAVKGIAISETKSNVFAEVNASAIIEIAEKCLDTSVYTELENAESQLRSHRFLLF
jgi:hypothetical protein